MNSKYAEKKFRQRATLNRLLLGINIFRRKPACLILLTPDIALAIFLFIYKEKTFDQIEISNLLYLPYKYSITVLCIIVPVIIAFAILTTVAEKTAQRIKNELSKAFDEKELRNGSPMLIDKRHIKDTDITTFEFYSNVSFNTWCKKQEDIAYFLGVNLVENISHKKSLKGKRVEMIVKPEGSKTERGKLYDEHF